MNDQKPMMVRSQIYFKVSQNLSLQYYSRITSKDMKKLNIQINWKGFEIFTKNKTNSYLKQTFTRRYKYGECFFYLKSTYRIRFHEQIFQWVRFSKVNELLYKTSLGNCLNPTVKNAEFPWETPYFPQCKLLAFLFKCRGHELSIKRYYWTLFILVIKATIIKQNQKIYKNTISWAWYNIHKIKYNKQSRALGVQKYSTFLFHSNLRRIS